MNSPPRKRRKTFFLTLGIVCILFTICVILLRHTPSEDSPRTFPGTSDSKSEPVQNVVRAAKPSSTPEMVQSASVAVTEAPNPKKDAADIPLTNFTTGTVSPPRPTALYTSGSLAIAVVDAERLLTELLPEAASPDTRAQTIRDIQRATSRVAATHNLDLVFDRSGKSLNNVPVISSASGVADLTEEVRRELTK